MPTASSSAIILSLSRIPRIDAHSSIFFSGALLSVGSGADGGVSRSSYSGARNFSAVITVLSGSGFGVVGGVIVGVDLGACEMPHRRRSHSLTLQRDALNHHRCQYSKLVRRIYCAVWAAIS